MSHVHFAQVRSAGCHVLMKTLITISHQINEYNSLEFTTEILLSHLNGGLSSTSPLCYMIKNTFVVVNRVVGCHVVLANQII